MINKIIMKLYIPKEKPIDGLILGKEWGEFYVKRIEKIINE